MPAAKISARKPPRAGDLAAEDFEDLLRRRLERPRGAGLAATLNRLLPMHAYEGDHSFKLYCETASPQKSPQLAFNRALGEM
jgi:hypothetical protein